LSSEEIAQRLGLTLVTVARHPRQLKALKLIAYQSRRIVILNKESLEKRLL
jgi:Mn-dependent DtxR family transcriptional regulator